MNTYKTTVNIVVTGTEWLGGGVGSIETALEKLFRDACDEISISAYAISSGADIIFEWIETALNRGVRVKLLVNRLEGQPPDVVARIIKLVNNYPHMHLYLFLAQEISDLHAKIIVIDRKKALVGSSNLSQRGLMTNYEMGLVIEGPAASEIAGTMDRLYQSRLVSHIYDHII